MRPWAAEIELGADEAGRLVESAFPHLGPIAIERLGVGWDNTAFLVTNSGGRWVFRFPRREIASGLLVTESRVLPAIAAHLPLPVPVPTMVHHDEAAFPWPFAGYAMLPGRLAIEAGLDDAARAALAEPLARFLGALHALPAALVAGLDAPPDKLGRLDVERRRPRMRELLKRCRDADLVPAPTDPLDAIIDLDPGPWRPGTSTLVHGDLHAGQVLVEDDNGIAAVIDWGDVHLGDPAVDLAVAHALLPPGPRASFRTGYGPIDDATWALARWRALATTLNLLAYGHETGNTPVVREAQVALRHVRCA